MHEPESFFTMSNAAYENRSRPTWITFIQVILALLVISNVISLVQGWIWHGHPNDQHFSIVSETEFFVGTGLRLVFAAVVIWGIKERKFYGRIVGILFFILSALESMRVLILTYGSLTATGKMGSFLFLAVVGIGFSVAWLALAGYLAFFQSAKEYFLKAEELRKSRGST